MPIRLYDSLTRTEKPLQPEDGRVFRFYCCGPTVYGPAHVGNFRAFVAQDILRRALEIDGLKTRHVRNLTDVDDKTIAQARREGKPLAEVTRHWTELFHKDCAALGILPPHVEPTATGHIKEQLQLIGTLVEKGNAYPAPGGSVYFRVSSFPDYGRLSRVKERELTTDREQAPGGPIEADEYARDSMADFALWKGYKSDDGDIGWESPWGRGRPGWHIECSAMSRAYLGDTFDLHAGGVDLMFPHHENEIAQSECCTGKTFARHWFHNAHLMVESQKMSKSLGNLYTLADVVERGHSPLALRYVLASGHYRQPLNFTWASVSAAESALHRLAKFAHHLEEKTGIAGDTVAAEVAGNPQKQAPWGPFQAAWEALENDLNVPAALGALFGSIGSIDKAPAGDSDNAAIQIAFYRILYALGLQVPKHEPAEEAPDEIKTIAENRWQAKKARNFAEADRLRDELHQAGWNILDSKDGYQLEPLKKN